MTVQVSKEERALVVKLEYFKAQKAKNVFKLSNLYAKAAQDTADKATRVAVKASQTPFARETREIAVDARKAADGLTRITLIAERQLQRANRRYAFAKHNK